METKKDTNSLDISNNGRLKLILDLAEFIGLLKEKSYLDLSEKNYYDYKRKIYRGPYGRYDYIDEPLLDYNQEIWSDGTNIITTRKIVTRPDGDKYIVTSELIDGKENIIEVQAYSNYKY